MLLLNCLLVVTAGSNAFIAYEISSTTPPSNLFKIDQVTGLILTNQFVEESHTGTCFEFTVIAKDQGVPQKMDTTAAIICVSDVNQPLEFDESFYNFSIAENQPAGWSHSAVCCLIIGDWQKFCFYCFKGSFVGTVTATDPDLMGTDSSDIEFSVVSSPSEQGFFTINATSVRQSIDRSSSVWNIGLMSTASREW